MPSSGCTSNTWDTDTVIPAQPATLRLFYGERITAMQLTLHTDYALRVLLYLSQKGQDLATITEIADFYGISRNHLVKVVHHLSGKGFIHTTRGKNGGMALAREPAQISIGEVVRRLEPNFNLVECFDASNPSCTVLGVCNLKGLLHKATKEFLATLDKYTLADALSTERKKLSRVFPVDWYSPRSGTG